MEKIRILKSKTRFYELFNEFKKLKKTKIDNPSDQVLYTYQELSKIEDKAIAIIGKKGEEAEFFGRVIFRIFEAMQYTNVSPKFLTDPVIDMIGNSPLMSKIRNLVSDIDVIKSYLPERFSYAVIYENDLSRYSLNTNAETFAERMQALSLQQSLKDAYNEAAFTSIPATNEMHKKLLQITADNNEVEEKVKNHQYQIILYYTSNKLHTDFGVLVDFGDQVKTLEFFSTAPDMKAEYFINSYEFARAVMFYDTFFHSDFEIERLDKRTSQAKKRTIGNHKILIDDYMNVDALFVKRTAIVDGKKSPHLRKGHFRKQRVGENRSGVKVIWIEDTVVGVDKS
ncbi:hypothetical protein [Flammeovirga aprica]|uniref:Uncharacterized protein n=1 Tax=Flammeovirga aprica JL-4 TaxID=694437 RepID=A0A7X9S1A7_9BACT|nr:hypothetical protein [Flammeovirga aprica]NME72533.1 hypothetical protein [Flammeovirga aprica JL-4]